MQGLSDGYFVVPYTMSDFLATHARTPVDPSMPEFQQARDAVAERTRRLLEARGTRTVDSFHRELGKLLWDDCGMSRNAAGLAQAIERIRDLREQYWRDVRVSGAAEEINQSLEKAGRVADFFELAELMCIDALDRDESCGAHFRVEHQTPDGEALRDDANFSYVAAWEFMGDGQPPRLHKEPLAFEYVHPSQRSYK